MRGATAFRLHSPVGPPAAIFQKVRMRGKMYNSDILQLHDLMQKSQIYSPGD